jgi:hypothetical protein
VQYVRAWGPLWAWSCFPFEDFNGDLLDNIHGTGNQCKQLFWSLHAQNTLRLNSPSVSNTAIKSFIDKMFSSRQPLKTRVQAINCKIVGKMHKCIVEDNTLKEAVKCLNVDATEVLVSSFLEAKRVIVNDQVIILMKITLMMMILIDSLRNSVI